MDNFGPSVTQNYSNLYLRICSIDFFKLGSIIGHSKQILTDIFQKNSLLGESL